MRMHLAGFALALAVIVTSPPVHAESSRQDRASSEKQTTEFHELYDAYWSAEMRFQGNIPDGEGSYTEGETLPDVKPAAQAERLAFYAETLARLDRISARGVPDDEAINVAVLRSMLETSLATGPFREWEMPFNSDTTFWTYLDARQPMRDAAAYRRYISRMRDLPRYFDDQIANMEAGLARGFSVPRATIEGRDQSISSFITETPEINAFYTAFNDMPQSIPEAERQALRAEAQAAITGSVMPAYRKLLDYYRSQYLPRTRTTISAAALPDGAAFYAAQIREYTTLEMSAQEIHQVGLAEVARIEAEMQRTMEESGFKGTLPEFIEFLRTDPQFYAKTPDELLMFSAYVAKRVDGRIGQEIGLLPRRRFTIVPVPDALAPFYTAGRGGLESCQMNTYNLPSRPLYNIPALTLHECSPGHSFQAALAEERGEVPEFRRYTYFSGFGEGWGLYSERLGIEMGIYRTPYENFGRLSYEMWRAARLVIDTGIHQDGWSREQAIEYLASHTALSRHEVETEVDRYISWPGQALAYKLGEMTIVRLRKQAEEALGPKFDVRKFHDVVLGLGSVPLPVLEQRIARFIADEGAQTPES